MRKLDVKLNETPVYTPVCVREELPVGLNRKQTYALTQELKEKGLSSKYVYAYIFILFGRQMKMMMKLALSTNAVYWFVKSNKMCPFMKGE